MSATAKRAYAVLAAGALFWCLLILLPPLLDTAGAPQWGLLARSFFAPVCHQEEARSFHLMGHALAVCHRCAGAYFGFAAAVLCLPFRVVPSRLRRLGPAALALLLLPMALDVALDLLGWWSNTPVSRAATGLCAGAGLACFVTPAWIRACHEIFSPHISVTIPGEVNDG